MKIQRYVPSLWDAFDDSRSLLDHFFRDLAPTRARTPTVRTEHSDEQVSVELDIPGYTPEDIEVNVDGNVLTVSGKHETEAQQDGEALRRERNLSSFSRRWTLPFRVNAEQATAEHRNGVLAITLPRASEDRTHTITVTSA